MTARVQDRVVIVSGAGSAGPGWGNGKAAATLYAREGAKVFAVDANADALAETHEIITGEGGDCASHVADVSEEPAVEALVAACIERFGRIDILHNNVGVFDKGGAETLSVERWDRLMAVNLRSMFLTTKHAIPHMVGQGGGAIVNISSVASQYWMGYANLSYSASKGAVNALTRQVALEYADRNIRCNAILPGSMDTPLTRAASKAVHGDEMVLIRQRSATMPLGRMGDGWDVAYAAVFLASDEAKFITGVELVIDGGATLVVA